MNKLLAFSLRASFAYATLGFSNMAYATGNTETTQLQQLLADQPEKWDEFGESVAIDGDTMVVGAWRANKGIGSAYVFEKNSNGQWQLVATLTADAPDNMDHFGEMVAISGDTIVVGAMWDDGVDNNLIDSGAVYVFNKNGGAWQQSSVIRATNAGGNDRFGKAVAIDGDTIVVGAIGESSAQQGVTNGSGAATDDALAFAGAAYVYVKDGSNWVQQAYLKSGHTDKDHKFGRSVAIDGDIVVVGAPYDDAASTGSYTGAAYTFSRSGTQWQAQQQLLGTHADDDGETRFFGQDVDISGNSIIVGSYGENDDTGAAYIFDQTGGQWTQSARLTADNADSRDEFAFHVAIDGDVVVIGATGEDGVSSADNTNGAAGADYWMPIHYYGAAYTFRRAHGVWRQQDYLKANDIANKDKFGQSVAIDGDTVVVGADQHDTSADDDGAAYVFAIQSANTGLQLSVTVENLTAGETITIENAGNVAEFTLDGNYPLMAGFAAGDTYAILVKRQPNGQVCEAKNQPASGTFADSDISVVLTCRKPIDGEITHTQQLQELLASDSEKWNEFGESVAISDDDKTIVVGAWRANGTKGAAYVFEQDSNQQWQQVAMLTAPDGDAFDHFGEMVAIDGDTIVIGSMWDDGVGNGIEDSGAAYIFTRQNGGWQYAQALRASNAGINDRFGKSVAIDGELIVIGATLESSEHRGVINGNSAPFDDQRLHSGAAYIFAKDSGSNWAQTAYLKANNADNNHQFGRSVSVEGEIVVVGAPSAGTVSTRTSDGRITTLGSYDGAVYVYRKVNGQWAETQHLTGQNPVGDGKTRFFGQSVALSANTLIVGSPYDEDGEGAAYIFDFNGNEWVQSKRLQASNADSRDEFGAHVAIDNDVIVIGAKYEDGPATTVNPDDTGNGTTGADYWMPIHYRGAAYTFRRSNGVWSQQDYLKSADLENKDKFGQSVAIAGNIVVVGADQHDTNAEDDGAAYIFVLPGLPTGVIFKDSFE